MSQTTWGVLIFLGICLIAFFRSASRTRDKNELLEHKLKREREVAQRRAK